MLHEENAAGVAEKQRIVVQCKMGCDSFVIMMKENEKTRFAAFPEATNPAVNCLTLYMK